MCEESTAELWWCNSANKESRIDVVILFRVIRSCLDKHNVMLRNIDIEANVRIKTRTYEVALPTLTSLSTRVLVKMDNSQQIDQ